MMLFFLLTDFYSRAIHFMEGHMVTCPSKKLMQMDCPGCGLQRSYISMLKGNMAESLQLYPAAIPILFMFVFLALQLKFRFKKGTVVLTWMYIFCALIIAVHYIYKVLTNQNF